MGLSVWINKCPFGSPYVGVVGIMLGTGWVLDYVGSPCGVVDCQCRIFVCDFPYVGVVGRRTFGHRDSPYVAVISSVGSPYVGLSEVLDISQKLSELVSRIWG